MGNLCYCCKKKVKRNIVLLLVGLDNAGKTVAAKGLAKERIDTVVPTVGFSVVNLSYMKYMVKIFDLGGGPSIRGIWHKYFVDAHGLIFVVDSSDLSRIDEAKYVIQETLSHEKVSGKPVLLLANKQDNECALDEVDIVEKLDLEYIVNRNACPTLVKSCAATDTKVDPNIKAGYEWLLNYIVRQYEHLNVRVLRDVAEQTAIESRIRMERIEKIRARKEAEQRTKIDDDAIESYSNYQRKMNGHMIETEVEAIGDGNNSENSNEELFSPVCHLPENKIERPKSATELIRKQLQLNTINNQRKFFISRASNKTAPLQLYDRSLPRPATSHGTRNNLITERRKLRSADDRFKITELPNVPLSFNESEYDKDFCNFLNIGNKTRIRSLPNTSKSIEKENHLPMAPKSLNGDRNGLSVVDVD